MGHKKPCVLKPQFKFCANLSYAQELKASPPDPPNPVKFIPLDPAVDPGVFGAILLEFQPDLSSLSFKLYVFNDLAPVDPNALIRAAHLHLGNASVAGPVTVPLYSAPLPGTAVNGLLVEGVVHNSDVIPVTSSTGYSSNTIASIYEAIRRGELYANVHGTGPNFAGGLARGQIFLA